MAKEYDESNRIILFKNDSDNEKAPHWSGRVTLSKQMLKDMPDDFTLRVAVWKTYPKDSDGGRFFLAGKVELPQSDAPANKKQFKKTVEVDEDDDWG